MFRSTKGYIETKEFDAYKARVAKLSDAQKKTNTTTRINAILAGADESNPSGVDTKNTQNTFGLSPEEIKNIENEIASVLPLGSPAMQKLFSTLGFSDVTSNEKNGKLTLGVNEYELFSTKAKKGPNQGKEVSVIRMPNHILRGENTDMANKAMAALRSLFPGKTIHFNLEALNVSADTHGIYPGYRDGDDGESGSLGGAVFSWTLGSGDAVSAPYAWRNRYGSSHSRKGLRLNAFCLVAFFR